MRFGGIALLTATAALLAGAGDAAAANPVTITLAALPASASSTQRCVSVTVADSVTNQPLAADVQLLVRSGLQSESLQAKTDPSGKGTLCLDPLGSVGFATVALVQGSNVLVHGSPDYPTSGTSNTVSVSWLPPASGVMTVTPTASAASVVAGQPETVDVKVAFSGTTAGSTSLQVGFSGAAPKVVSATTDHGTCTTATGVTCALADIANGGQANVELSLDPETAGQLGIAFTVTWTAARAVGSITAGGSLSGSTTASLALTVTAPSADLRVALGRPAGKLRLGTPATVQVSIRDAGPQGAAGETVVVRLPAALRLLRFVGGGATCSPATRTCTLPALAAATTSQLGLTVVPRKAGAAKITVRVAATGATDPVTANNTATLAVTVPPKA